MKCEVTKKGSFTVRRVVFYRRPGAWLVVVETAQRLRYLRPISSTVNECGTVEIYLRPEPWSSRSTVLAISPTTPAERKYMAACEVFSYRSAYTVNLYLVHRAGDYDDATAVEVYRQPAKKAKAK